MLFSISLLLIILYWYIYRSALYIVLVLSIQEFSKLCGDKEQLTMLLDRINSPFVRTNTSVLQGLMRMIPFLAFGEDDKMFTLLNHFKPYLEFSK